MTAQRSKKRFACRYSSLRPTPARRSRTHTCVRDRRRHPQILSWAAPLNQRRSLTRTRLWDGGVGRLSLNKGFLLDVLNDFYMVGVFPDIQPLSEAASNEGGCRGQCVICLGMRRQVCRRNLEVKYGPIPGRNAPKSASDVGESSGQMVSEIKVTHGRKFPPQGVIDPVYDNIKSSCRVIWRLCRFYGYTGDFEATCLKTVDRWLGYAKELGGPDPWIKIIKYKTTAFLAYWLGLEQPELPLPRGGKWDKPSVLFGGQFYRWMRILSGKAHPDCFTNFLFAILQSKKGLPRPGKEFLKAARDKTFDKLFVTPPPRPIAWDPIYSPTFVSSVPLSKGKCTVRRRVLAFSRKFLKEQLRRTVKELFGKTSLSPSELLAPGFPSTSANYIRSRNDMGCVSVILDQCRQWKKGVPEREASYQDALNNRPKVEERRVFDDEKGQFLLKKIVSWNSSALNRFHGKFAQSLWTQAAKEDRKIEFVALPEALKARVITKGPALMGYCLKAVQKKMHSTLRAHSVFQLIGKPQCEEAVIRQLGILRYDEEWCSGDYSDATNDLFSWASRTVMETLCDIWLGDYHHKNDEIFSGFTAGDLRKLLVDSLVGHVYHDPTTGVNYSQTNGQLMGSITSFPVLCMVNATLCRMSCEYSENSTLRLSQCRLLINGDDCAMPLTSDGYQFWRALGPSFGLSPSIGKCWFTPKFVNINSTMFNYHPFAQDFITVQDEELLGMAITRRVRRTFVLGKYVNMGLLEGVKRSGVSDESVYDRYGCLASRAKELLQLSPSLIRDEVYREFLRGCKRALTKQKVFVPWFVPKRFGGLGLPLPVNEELSLEDRTRCLMLQDRKQTIDICREVVPWQMHKNVIDKSLDTVEKVEFGEPWQAAYTQLVMCDLYHAVDVGDHHLYDPIFKENKVVIGRKKQKQATRLLRQAERLFLKLGKSSKRPAKARVLAFDPLREQMHFYPETTFDLSLEDPSDSRLRPDLL